VGGAARSRPLSSRGGVVTEKPQLIQCYWTVRQLLLTPHASNEAPAARGAGDHTQLTMTSTHQFTDRIDAGEQLAAALEERAVDADLVLAIPRGGLPVGRTVADALGHPLDVVVAKKIGAPGHPEYAIGAVTSDGSVWRNDRALRLTGSTVGYFRRKRAGAQAAAREQAADYRESRPEATVAGTTVVLVDDGVATGSTLRACLEQVRAASPERVVLAVPVCPPETATELQEVVDEFVCLVTPSSFRAVSQVYDRFEQVSDAAAKRYLAGSAPAHDG